MLFPVIVGDETFKYPFGRVVQQSSSGSENILWRSEKNVVQQTMLEAGDNEVVEVMTRYSASTKTVTLSSPALGLCLNTAGPDAIRAIPYSGSPSLSVPPYI